MNARETVVHNDALYIQSGGSTTCRMQNDTSPIALVNAGSAAA